MLIDILQIGILGYIQHWSLSIMLFEGFKKLFQLRYNLLRRKRMFFVAAIVFQIDDRSQRVLFDRNSGNEMLCLCLSAALKAEKVISSGSYAGFGNGTPVFSKTFIIVSAALCRLDISKSDILFFELLPVDFALI